MIPILSRGQIIQLLSTSACDLCPYDKECSGIGECHVKTDAAKLLDKDAQRLHKLKNTVTQLLQKVESYKAFTETLTPKPTPKKRPLKPVYERSINRKVYKIHIHGYMPWTMRYFLESRERAQLPSKPYKHCFVCGRVIEPAEVPVGVTIDDVGNRFICHHCFKKAEAEISAKNALCADGKQI